MTAAAMLYPGSLAAAVAGALWTWALALLLGAATLGAADDRDADLAPGARLLGWAVVGVPVQSLCWLALSAAGALRPTVVVATAAALTALGIASGGRRVVAATRDLLRGTAREGLALLAHPLAVASLLALVATLLLALRLALVPTAYYDDLVYHLGLPHQALLEGAWPSWPRFHHAFMPAGWDAAYLLPLSLGGGSGPQLMNVVALGLFAAAAYRLARRGGAVPAALAATALLVACRMLVSLGAFAGTDLFVGLALVTGVDRLLAARGSRPLATGLLAGAAGAAKYTALPLLGALALAHAWLPGGSAARRARAVVLAGLACAALAAPWHARALALTGNPLYPAHHDVLGGRDWTDRAAGLLRSDSSVGSARTRGARAFVLAPVDLALRSTRLGYPSGLDVVYLIVAAAGLVLATRRVRHAGTLVLLAGLTYLGWAATSLMLRFALALLALLLPFAAGLVQAGLERLRDGPAVRWGFAAALVVAAAAELAAGPARHALAYGDEPDLLREPRADVLTQLFPAAAAGRDLDDVLPDDARVLLVGEAMVALVPRRVVASTALDEPAVGDLLDGAAGPADVTARARAAGLTHVLLNRQELERWSRHYAFRERLPPGGDALLNAWLASLEPVGRWGEVLVWALPR